jgi:hypothetical protein
VHVPAAAAHHLPWQVAAHLESRIWKANVHVLATCAWGLANCGHIPSDAFVEELLAASMPKLRLLEAAEAVMLGQALAKFGYRPNAPTNRVAASADDAGSSSSSSGGAGKRQRLWNKWWERYCNALNNCALHPKQVRADAGSTAPFSSYRACVW